MNLSFARLRLVNESRCKRWHPGFPTDDNWTGADWTNAMAGEAGEACNVMKKIRRHETGRPGKVDPPSADLVKRLGDELADTIIYADLVAAKYGIDLSAAVIAKFNAVSEREGFPEKLDPDGMDVYDEQGFIDASINEDESMTIALEGNASRLAADLSKEQALLLADAIYRGYGRDAKVE